MSIITKDLGAVTAYAYAVEQGYTGTEEEFAELMADYAAVEQRAAQSATAAQTSASNASQSATASAQSASQASASATAAGQSASTASTKADEASTSAQTAGAKATEASGYAFTASTKASEASQSASAASGYATDAGQAKTAAQSAQTAAEGSATTAQTAAQTATTKAAEAAESARTLTIDPTLTQSGQAADAKVVGDEIEGVKSELSNVKRTKTITPTGIGSKVIRFDILIGDTIKVTNTTSGLVEIRLRASEDAATNLQVVRVTGNSSLYFIAEADASYISAYFNQADGSAVIEAGHLIAVEKDVEVNTDYISGLIRSITFATELSGSAVEQKFAVKNGETVKITNNSSAGCVVRLRETSGGQDIQTVNVTSSNTAYFVAQSDAEYMSVYFAGTGTTSVNVGRIIDDEGALHSLSESYAKTSNTVSGLIKSITFSTSAVGSVEQAFSVKSGESVKIFNNSSAGCVIRLRETSGGQDIQTVNVPAGKTGYLLAEQDTEYISIYFAGTGSAEVSVGQIVNDESVLYNLDDSYKNTSWNVFDFLVLESGGITASGKYVDLTTRLRTVNTLQGTFKCHCPDGFVIYYAVFFDEYGKFDSSTAINAQTATITVPNGKHCKLTFCKTNGAADIAVEEIKSSYVLEEYYKKFDIIDYPPMVAFNLNNFAIDSSVTTIVESKEYSRNPNSIFEIYSFFDELVDNEYVTKVDLATEMDIEYPAYANGVTSGDETYEETPAYKTYMYKLSCSNEYVNTSLQPKKKIIMLGGVHGDEAAAPFNLYIFAKKLCDDFLTDENFFKLRSAFDFYIVPCVNGYGLIHSTRVNANGININRNFPIETWTVEGAGTENYSGETAGSEFETQLVMALVNSVKPDMFVDHHNYSFNLDTQFYTDIFDLKQNKLVYQSLVDVSYVLKHNYSSYFGSSFDLVKHNVGNPGVVTQIYLPGTTVRWAYEKKVPLAVSIEISDCINYLNGEHVTARQEFYTAKTFCIAEYTLRQQMLRYGQWVLGN